MAEEEKKSQTIFQRNKFFATTSVAGFGLIQSSNSKLEISIWYIIILVFSAITIRNVIVLTVQYKHQEPIAIVSLEEWDGYINTIYISYPIILPGLYKEYNVGNTSFPYSFNGSLISDLDKAITNLNTKEKIIGQNATWPYVLLPLIAKYTAFMKSVERFRNVFDLQKVFSHEKMFQKSLGPFLNRFIHHANQLNVTNNQLMEKWFKLVINMTFNIIKLSNQQYYNLEFTDFDLKYIRRNSGTFVYMIGFQMKRFLLIREAQWTLNYINVVKILHGSGVFGYNFTLSGIHMWYREQLLIGRWVLERRPGLFIFPSYLDYLKNSNRLMRLDFARKTIRQVKTAYTFHSISQNCNNALTKSECYLKCRNTFIVKKCNCLPLNSSFDNNLLPCSLEDYKQCRRWINDDNQHINCKDSCPPSCSQNVLSFDHTIIDYQYGKNVTVVRIHFWFVSTPHPVFQETYRQSEAQFWAALGGAFDFWIGISVISTVHLIVYLIKQLIYTFRKNTKTGINIRELFHGLKSQQMVTALTLGMTQRPPIEQNESSSGKVINNEAIEALIKKMDTISEKVETMAEKMENMAQEQEKLKEFVYGQ